MKRFGALLITALMAITLLSPVSPAKAASIYDPVALSSLRNMVNAMTFYNLYSPRASYEGVTQAELRKQGWSPAANVAYEIWIEGTGKQYRATAQDIRNGTLYSFSSSGTFNGRNAGSVGAASPQPGYAPPTAGFIVNDLNSSLDVEALAALMAGVALNKICEATLFQPGTRNARSSVSDQTLACQAAAAAPGATVRSVLLAIRTAGGAEQLAMLAAYFVGDGTSPATVPDWVDGTDRGPRSSPPVPETLPPLWRLPKSAPQFGTQNGLGDEAAKTALKQCYALVAFAGTFGDPYKTCRTLPIFASGQSDVPQATNHDLEALQQTPSWVKLDYRPSTENPSPRSWYTGDPRCASADPAEGTSCDEYPFYSSEQGGQLAVPAPSLKVIDSGQNSFQGTLYSSFLAACKLTAKPVGERQFLAIPLPPAASPLPTLAICNGN
ncbi:NucA/NucB deoxyribonuclease domain-containing protein [Microcella flavibacter]|uniref:NucA/NucB deoxyribonuclease domain-containing protein n=1 Tax=Microcella flavibacter TaxID=1804990 RepID=UPI0014564DF8|nr:hypothetical protein [Microcella flavibacter]